MVYKVIKLYVIVKIGSPIDKTCNARKTSLKIKILSHILASLQTSRVTSNEF
jgi:hypothetical protein